MALTLFSRRALPFLTVLGASGAYLAINRMHKTQAANMARRHDRLALWETARSGGGF
ncbi:hypothetical protein TWF481_010098 [Arthrobotrys musiformis]|uniref:HIG1 domain-containing protein n=1 Tax=Arthrobotrys musiformis TaxID=47236 RepID=A0AAV9VZZ6_9PEZI